jgi:hypothetical protein
LQKNKFKLPPDLARHQNSIIALQNHLPLNQLNFPAVDPLLAFNTTISFITNTNWQAYGGESTLSNFSQMGGHHLSDVHIGGDWLRRGNGLDPGIYGP